MTRVALFVEGSEAPPHGRRKPALEAIWTELLGEALGIRHFDLIFPISKKNLVAMDRKKPAMSGAGEALDQLMVRKLKTNTFQAAVVAWDVVPAWNPAGNFCRWQETLDFYRGLSDSKCLPDSWTSNAQRRFDELSLRQSPSDRVAPPPLEQWAIQAVCMEPMFEALLTQNERYIRRVLGLSVKPPGWPTKGWADPNERQPDTRVLGPVVRAASKVRPKLQAVKHIRGDLRTRKNEWGEYLLRGLLSDSQARQDILEHPIVCRLKEVAPINPGSSGGGEG